MLRCENNPNLVLVYGDEWRGLPLGNRPPYAERYLQINLNVMRHAFMTHRRCLVIFMVLRFPCGYPIPEQGVVTRFIRSLKAQIKADLHARNRESGRYLKSDVLNVWCREIESSDHCHYHLALFLNLDAYNTLGNFAVPEWDYLDVPTSPIRPRATSMYQRLNRAWAGALGLAEWQAEGLVQYPRNSVSTLDSGSLGFTEQYYDLFRRLSYFAKIETKDFGSGLDCYGSSVTPVFPSWLL